MGETNGTRLAGGNGRDQRLDQLNSPLNVFVDVDYSVDVSDLNNHRAMKWMKDAKEGIVVASGQGSALTQLKRPRGLIVDQFGSLYVAGQWSNALVERSKRGKCFSW